MDFYALLGVPRTASAAEIERAFRRLARRYHPGVNPGDRVSEDTYRQIEVAYGVLSNADERREYDRGVGARSGDAVPVAAGVAFEGFDFSTPAEGPLAATFSELFADVFQHAAREATSPTRGADLELPVRVSFVDAARGADVPLSLTRQERCAACAGRGAVRRAPVVCRHCNGVGSSRWARGHLVFSKTCEVCGGRGQVEMEGCHVCAGVGTTARTEVLTVRVPAAVESGARIAVPGRGQAGARGGPAGDLYVILDVAPHSFFRREGRDLCVSLPVAVHEAALGARVNAPSLEGAVKVRVPANSASGDRLRIPGHGLGAATDIDGRGDLVVDLQIVLPAALDEASKNLLKEFGRLNDTDVRRHLFDH